MTGVSGSSLLPFLTARRERGNHLADINGIGFLVLFSLYSLQIRCCQGADTADMVGIFYVLSSQSPQPIAVVSIAIVILGVLAVEFFKVCVDTFMDVYTMKIIVYLRFRLSGHISPYSLSCFFLRSVSILSITQ